MSTSELPDLVRDFHNGIHLYLSQLLRIAELARNYIYEIKKNNALEGDLSHPALLAHFRMQHRQRVFDAGIKLWIELKWFHNDQQRIQKFVLGLGEQLDQRLEIGRTPVPDLDTRSRSRIQGVASSLGSGARDAETALKWIMGVLEHLLTRWNWGVLSPNMPDLELPLFVSSSDLTALDTAVTELEGSIAAIQKLLPKGDQGEVVLQEEPTRASSHCMPEPVSPSEPPETSVPRASESKLSETHVAPSERWLRVTEAATLANVQPSVISRAADNGTLKSNGEKGRPRRIDLPDLKRWILGRSNSPERTESDAHVTRLFARTSQGQRPRSSQH